MLILQIKEGEILQVGDARIAWIRRDSTRKNQIRIAVEADMTVKVNRTKQFMSKEFEENAKGHSRGKAPTKKARSAPNKTALLQNSKVPIIKRRR